MRWLLFIAAMIAAGFLGFEMGVWSGKISLLGASFGKLKAAYLAAAAA